MRRWRPCPDRSAPGCGSRTSRTTSTRIPARSSHSARGGSTRSEGGRPMPDLPCILVCCLLLGQPVAKGLDLEPAARVVAVRRIWDRAPHNAFTDLVRSRDRWFCAFREGRDHVSPDGAIRVITSPDGREWTSAAHLVSAKADLRDPKLTVTPAGRLMLNAVAAGHPPGTIGHQSMTWLSDDGQTWDSGHEVGEPD